MKDEVSPVESSTAVQPRILFKPTSWLAKIDFINHLILFNNVLITVLSEKEGGKSCFNTLLQNNLDQQIKSVAMTLTPPCNKEFFINEIATQLHLNNDANTDIGAIVDQINERKAHVLLVIDNAQNLPEDIIKEMMLAIKSQESFGFFHVCLVSDYSIVATLNNLAVDQFNNLIHTIELGVLNESETRTYVLQRAMNARLINRPLTDAQFKEFYQLTKGNLAKINAGLEPFILKCSDPKKAKKIISVKKVSAAISAVFVAAVSYVYFDTMYQSPEPTKIVTTKVTKRLGNLFTRNHAELAQAKPLESEIPSWLNSSTRQFVQFALPKKQYLDEEMYKEEEEEDLNTVAVLDKVVVIPKIKPKDGLLDHKFAMADKPSLKPIEQDKVRVATKTVKATKAKVNTTSVAKKRINNSATAYTIQLAASHNQSDVTRFKSRDKSLASAKIRHFTNAKGSWYILTLGEYNSRAEALQQATKLPPTLAKLSPWVRSVSGLDNIG